MISRSPATIPPHKGGSLHVVLVEDDAELRDAILVPALADAGCSVIGVGSAAELYRAIVGRPPDVVVLDVGLPDESGFEVARHLRSNSDVGIVLLTGRASAIDFVHGLDLGADAYLSKPVEPAVLCATVRSVARRLKRVPDPGNAWRLDADGWSLVVPDGSAVPLSAAERDLLRPLFATPGVPVPRDALIARLTHDACAFDPHRLDMLMHRLRRKLADGGMPPLPLRAVRGVGYVWVSDAGPAASD
jgi:two-component system response regulator PhoP